MDVTVVEPTVEPGTNTVSVAVTVSVRIVESATRKAYEASVKKLPSDFSKAMVTIPGAMAVFGIEQVSWLVAVENESSGASGSGVGSTPLLNGAHVTTLVLAAPPASMTGNVRTG